MALRPFSTQTRAGRMSMSGSAPAQVQHSWREERDALSTAREADAPALQQLEVVDDPR